jgi:hypothetical protein
MIARRLLLLTILIGPAAVTADPPRPPADPKTIPRLIVDLGSDEFETRERAAGRLLELEEAALPALQEAARSTDAEVRRQAELLTAEITVRVEERRLRQLLEGLDHMLERMVREKGYATPERWQSLLRAVEALVTRATEVGGKPFGLPALDLARLAPQSYLPLEGHTDHARVLVDGTFRPTHSLRHSVLVSSDSVRKITFIADSVVLINGDLEEGFVIENSVVICRGAVRNTGKIENCVVLTAGALEDVLGLHGCIVQSPRVEGCAMSKGCVFVNLPRSPAEISKEDRCVTTKHGPMSLLRFNPAAVPKVDDAAVRTLLAEAERMGLGRFLERMVREPDFATEERWQVVARLVPLLAARASEASGRPFRAPRLDFGRLPVVRARGHDGRFDDARVLLAAPAAGVSEVRRCLVLCDGPLDHPGAIADSVVLVTGDVCDAGLFDKCLVLSLGEIDGGLTCRDTVLLANGPARLGEAANSLIDAAGPLTCRESRRTVFLNQPKVPAAKSHEDVCLPAASGALALLRLAPRKEASRDPDAEDRAAAALLAEVNGMGVERFLQRMVLEQDFVTEDRWKMLYQLAEVMARRASDAAGRRFRAPLLDLAMSPVTGTLPNGADVEGKNLLLDGATSGRQKFWRCLIVCRGRLRGASQFTRCVLIVDYDIEDCGDIRDCVVFCRGTIRQVGRIENSVVVAARGIDGAHSLRDCLFQGGAVRSCDESRESVYLNFAKPPAERSEQDRCVKTERGPLELLGRASQEKK